MANFCGNCGATLAGSFCNKCGTRAPEASAPVGQPATPAAAAPVQIAPQATPQAAIQPAGSSAPPAKGSGLGKVLLIVGGVLLLVFVIFAGAAKLANNSITLLR